MGVFDDKKFEELDWISQAMEPIDSALNDVLSNIPEEQIIDFEMYRKMTSDSYGLDLSLDHAIYFMARKHLAVSLSWKERDALKPCFKFSIEGDEILLDFEQNEITGGTIKLIKLKSTMDEKALASLLGNEGLDSLNGMFLGQESLGRMNEILELLGKCEDGIKTRSIHKKKSVLLKRVRTIFKDNEWKIKDTELANKIGRWIKSYVMNSDLAALSNFCRLKVMTHKDQPIYSMEEVQ